MTGIVLVVVVVVVAVVVVVVVVVVIAAVVVVTTVIVVGKSGGGVRVIINHRGCSSIPINTSCPIRCWIPKASSYYATPSRSTIM